MFVFEYDDPCFFLDGIDTGTDRLWADFKRRWKWVKTEAQ
jgi:hypothetical protein